MSSLLPSLELAYSSRQPVKFTVHRWQNPTTDCQYPFLAVTADRSQALLLGDYGACFELVPSGEVERWLPDYRPTRRSFSLELSGLAELIEAIFVRSAGLATVRFDEALRITKVELALDAYGDDTFDITYGVQGGRNYRRQVAACGEAVVVSSAEQALLDVCSAIFEPLARRLADLLREPPTPKYRQPAVVALLQESQLATVRTRH